MRSAIRQDGEKDMSAVHEFPRFKKVLESGRADLTDLLMEHKVEMQWDLSEESKREQIFKIIIDDNIEILLDLEEFLHYSRAI